MRRRKGPPRPRPAPQMSLTTLAPYFVSFTVISGGFALIGTTLGNVPILVVASWGLFLVCGRPEGASVRPVAYLPAGSSIGAGVLLALSPFLPMGARVASLAFLSTGLAWALLPRAGGNWGRVGGTWRLDT